MVAILVTPKGRFILEHGGAGAEKLAVFDTTDLLKEQLNVRSNRVGLKNGHKLKLDGKGHLLPHL